MLGVDAAFGHALSSDDLPREGLRDIVSTDLHQVAVEVLYASLEPEKGFLKSNAQVHEEVVIDALEPAVRLLLDVEDEVTLDHVGDLLCLSLKDHLVSVLHAFLNVNSQRLLVIDHLPALAVGTVLGSDLAATLAAVTRRLHLHLHSETDLDVLHHDSLAVALRAGFGLAVLGACASALWAVDVASNVHVTACARVHLIQGHPHVGLC